MLKLFITLFLAVILFACSSAKKEAEIQPKDAGPVYESTPSGIKYRDIKVGQGDTPAYGQKVTINFIGKLEDGTVFESTYSTKQPISFSVGDGEAIRGLDEGVMGMKEGGKRELVLSPDLAFGERGAGNKIPPDATVTLEVELIKIEK